MVCVCVCVYVCVHTLPATANTWEEFENCMTGLLANVCVGGVCMCVCVRVCVCLLRQTGESERRREGGRERGRERRYRERDNTPNSLLNFSLPLQCYLLCVDRAPI